MRGGGDSWLRSGAAAPVPVPVPSPDYLFVTPSLAVSGGNLEILRLARDLRARGARVGVVALWRAASPLDAGDVPVVTLSRAGFGRWRALAGAVGGLVALHRLLARAGRAPRVVFGHYSTFLLAPAVPRARRWFLVQDLEWRFARGAAYRAAVKRLILATLRRGRVVTAGAYLSGALDRAGVRVAARVEIWADPGFAAPREAARDIDLTLVLRRGAHKRADLAHALVARARARFPAWRIAAITPDGHLAAPIGDALAVLLVRPDRAAMRALHARSRLHLLLSDHEGFGLPPLEAMGAGCVPLCRDAGGVRAYMTGALAANLAPLDEGVDALVDRAAALLGDAARWRALSAAAGRVFDAGQRAQGGRLDAPAARAFVSREQT